jgi:hypothetical protein
LELKSEKAQSEKLGIMIISSDFYLTVILIYVVLVLAVFKAMLLKNFVGNKIDVMKHYLSYSLSAGRALPDFYVLCK